MKKNKSLKTSKVRFHADGQNMDGVDKSFETFLMSSVPNDDKANCCSTLCSTLCNEFVCSTTDDQQKSDVYLIHFHMSINH